MHPRSPILVGGAQITQRAADPLTAREPLLLLAAVIEAAAEDAGVARLPALADSVRVPQGLWDYSNPAGWLRERLGASGAETMSAEISGTSVLALLHDGARQILAGQRDVVIIAGAEAEHSARRARRAGHEPQRSVCDNGTAERFFRARGDHDPVDRDAGFRDAPTIFALFESAIRHQRGESVSAHRQRIAGLWAGLARVAADNPYAWLRTAPDADTIATASADNRWVVNPYTKLMVSNMVVDQAAALILTSVERARRLGIPQTRWVHLHAGVDAALDRPVSRRMSYYDEPPMRIVGERLLELAAIQTADLTHVDLYSCFPAAVQLGADAFGLAHTRPLSVTGGLTFHGGPFNSYVIHSLATMLARLRAAPDALGLVTGVGGAFSKHAGCVLGAAPPAAGFRYADVADQVAALPQRSYTATHVGAVQIEAYAVVHPDQRGPERALIACLTPDNQRCWAHSRDADSLNVLAAEDLVGHAAQRSADGTLTLG